MSSHKAAVAKPARAPKPATRAAAKPLRAAAKPAPAARPAPQAATALSEEAARLAAAIERELAEGRADMLTTEAFHALMGALCRVYAAQVENCAKHTPIPEGQVVSPTGVMLTASGLLRAANLAVFELGMWQSWTGR